MDQQVDFPPGTETGSSVTEDGLVLGMRSLLVRMGRDDAGRQFLDTETDRERALALFSVVARRPFGVAVLSHVEAAAAYWHAGDKALANLGRDHAQAFLEER